MKAFFSLIFQLSLSVLFGQSDQLYIEIDKIIRYDTEINYPLEQSFIVGVIYHDSTHIINFGPRHIDTMSLFEIGGVTKVFTAMLATKLESEGFIDLKDPINSFLPSKFQNPDLDEKTLEDLLMHTIPFPKRPSDLSTREFNISDPYAYYTKEDLLNYYSTFKPRKSDRLLNRSIDYSHINYGLLEVILETRMKMHLEELFQVYLLPDLGLQSTSLHVDPLHLNIGFDRSNMIPDPWTYASFAGSEGLKSSMEDLLVLLKKSIAQGDSLTIETQKLRAKSKKTRNLFHTYAWYMMSSKKAGKIYTHSGVTERHKVYVHFKPDSKTGVVILCDSSIGLEDLGLLILRMINNNYKD